ncbi:MAG: tetratricopeptide repeat protein, partial [Muribaculaceae bacterium]|nr:tetratricopeptide repeat protein [Muribaculaceae bacterium]
MLREPALLLRGSIPFDAGYYPAALRRLEGVDAQALEPGLAETLTFRVAFCRMMLGEYAAAESLFEQLTGAPEYAAAARFYLGYTAYAQGEYSKAQSLLEQVNTSEAPGDMAPYYLAQIYYMQANYNKSLAMARELIDRPGVAPEFEAEALRIAGESLYNLGEEVQAITLLRRYVAMAFDPLPSTRYMLGVAEYRAGNYAEAIRELGPVAGEDNSIGQSACLYIGQAYLKEGNNASALLALEKACAMNFDEQVTETAYYN